MELVLIVDDSAFDRTYAAGILAKSGEFQIEFAADGEEALRKIAELRPTIVLTDLMMPGMSGLELVDEAVRRWPLLPIILMTGRGSEETAVKAIRAGAANYVPKSAIAPLLEETVRGVAAIYQSRRTQANLMNRLVRSESTFDLGIDDALITPLIGHLQATLISSGVCDEGQAFRVSIALEEAIRNALFHGNLEITSEQREGDCEIYRALLEQRRNAEPYRSRRLFVTAAYTPEAAVFTIRDEGPGFDPNGLRDPTDPENIDKASGRGILLMRTFMDDVRFNAPGNEVVMTKRRAPAE